ncbi:deaminase [Microbacterium faecale]|uniref:Deaminase n=1 Tax=Microbacterium faecale TaxID=1804630 RepID=A0A917DJ60_9MICO|nr:dihydrofolate reductase family protein [Microbacterium faecale]GGD42825.1 deaminase [Microbacterium faecale]
MNGATAQQVRHDSARGIVLLHASVSLDGFIAGPEHEQEWIFELSEPSPAMDEVMETTGAFLGGRHTYDVGVRDDRPAFEGAWSGPQFVLTHNPPADAPTSITFLNTDIIDAVAQALAAADGKNLAITGANVARQCLEAGLIDEIFVHVLPVLLGDGVRLFEQRSNGRINIEQISSTPRGRTTELRYRVNN